MQQIRDTGARIRLISDGDVAGAIAAARPDSGTDILIGTGGTPEGIIAAAAMRCMGEHCRAGSPRRTTTSARRPSTQATISIAS